ncbi:MAG: hypothetical protein HYT37_02330 [Candidatus Sungbacteria bacterium]|nr:hypothetical protein [Candidatus Sungbacteria bacterium]
MRIHAKADIPFTLHPLDKKLVLAKPKHSVKASVVKKLEEEGKLVITRKRDGYRMLVGIADGNIRFFTRGISETTAHFPQLAEEIKKLDLPSDGVLLDGELVVHKDGKDDISTLTSIVKSTPGEARKLQEKHLLTYIILNVVMWERVLLTHLPFNERLNYINFLFIGNQNFPFPLPADQQILPIETLWYDLATAQQHVREQKWEGLVLYDRTKPTEIRLDGNIMNPPRPNGCWKWKPAKEDDFIVRRWAYGTKGKAHEHRMGKLFLSQINPKTGKEVPCGELGGGFKVYEREFFAKEVKYPLVVQVRFEKMFPSNALRNPVFVRIRWDKTPAECILRQGGEEE